MSDPKIPTQPKIPSQRETVDPGHEIFNLEEAARFLGVSVKTFNKVLHSENLPARKIGREWKFSRAALVAWVAAGRSDRYYRESSLARNGDLQPQPPQHPPGRQQSERDVSDADEGPKGRRRTTGWRLEEQLD